MLLLVPVGVALNGTSSVLYGTVAEFVRDDRQSRSFGLFYTLGSAAGAIAPLVFGLVERPRRRAAGADGHRRARPHDRSRRAAARAAHRQAPAPPRRRASAVLWR